MPERIMMLLVQPARKGGGDKYETKDGSWAIYLPQGISRKSGSPADVIHVTIETES